MPPGSVSTLLFLLMKLTYWLLAGGLLLATRAQAQLGVRAGGNFSLYTEHWSVNAHQARVVGQLGYQVGIFDELALGPRWALVPEVQFSRESQYFHRSGNSGDHYYINDGTYLLDDYRVGLSFLNLPVLLRRYIGPVYLEAGPQLSVLVGGRGVGTTQHVQLSPYGNFFFGRPEAINQAATAYYNRLDAGASVGLGLRLPVGWGAAVRGYWGFTSFTGDSRGYQYQPGVMPATGTQNRCTYQASITYQPFAARAASSQLPQ